MRFPRSSGILCHVTSLPARFGIGDLGPTSYRFVDFLAAAGQKVWQILPLNPPGPGNSPYSSYSAFAGYPMLISPDALVDDGLLSMSDLDAAESQANAGADPRDDAKVDFAAVTEVKGGLIRKAFDAFSESAGGHLKADFDAYQAGESWLAEFSRFEALMWHFGQPDWTKWPIEIVRRFADSMQKWDDRLATEIQFSRFTQFIVDRQWKAIKKYAADRGVRTYGDMPIFVAHESADVWANQNLFALDPFGKPMLVAGVPPDYFSKTGQLWGNPQYRWDVLESTGYAWWTARFKRALAQFDLLRVDHFRGFEAYWEVPATAKTAVSGTWKKGPCEKPFLAAKAALGPLPMIAEDLGMITAPVHALRDNLGFPGMRVFQFGFDDPSDDFHRPNAYPDHSVAYTGTHDNDTLMGWFSARKQPDALLAPYLTDDRPVHLQLIDGVLKSASDTAIVPIQDYLGLGNEARMNVPGQANGNWAWRLDADALADDLAASMQAMARESGR